MKKIIESFSSIENSRYSWFLIVFLSLINLSSLEAFSQKSVILDNYYNCEFDKLTSRPFHYLWNDSTSNGFSEFGKLFSKHGAKIGTLTSSPNIENLKVADVYIIVDPDNKEESPSPNFMNASAANEIANWVKNGGVLLMLANDNENCDLDNLNILACMFGMKFNKDILHSENSIPGKPRNFDSCASKNLPNHQLFLGVEKIFLKGISSINCTQPAQAILEEENKIIIAEATYGKGKIIAVGDPWLYNEYIGHTSLPTDFDNHKVAENLVKLLINK